MRHTGEWLCPIIDALYSMVSAESESSDSERMLDSVRGLGQETRK